METQLLNSTSEDLKIAGNILQNGGVVAIPTETVYGLAANALDKDAVAKIFIAKGRPMDNPLIVHICDISDISKFDLVKEIPEKAKALAEKFWPGPLTMIFKKTDKVPNEVSANLDTVAIRFPSHKIAKEIIKEANVPLAAPSANISGKPSPTSYSHVLNDMFNKVDAIVDGGDCNVGVESTVISMVEDIPRLFRPGKITVEDIESVVGKIIVDKAVLNQIEKDEKVSSPGMKYKHYSPKAKVVLLRGDSDKFIDFVNKEANENIACICYDEDVDKINAYTVPIGKEKDLEEQARKIFDALRKIDNKENILKVYAHCPSAKGVGMALYNRLIRAAGFEVIDLE